MFIFKQSYNSPAMMKKAHKKLVNLTADILHLIYPDTCLICERENSISDSICTFCLDGLYFTYYESYQEPNPMEKMFWGKSSTRTMCGLTRFSKRRKHTRNFTCHKIQEQKKLGCIFR
jgi:hypothetical protein